MARVPSLRHLLRFGLMHSIAKPIAFEGSHPSLLPGPLEIWEKDMHHFAKDRAKVLRSQVPGYKVDLAGSKNHKHEEVHGISPLLCLQGTRKVTLGFLLPSRA